MNRDFWLCSGGFLLCLWRRTSDENDLEEIRMKVKVMKVKMMMVKMMMKMMMELGFRDQNFCLILI